MDDISDNIIKDSSIWRDTFSFQKHAENDTRIKIGLVRAAKFNEIRGEITYIVEVQDQGDKLFIPCRQMRRFGGPFNYEDYTLQTYKYDTAKDSVPAFDTKAGDFVLVCYLNGDPREGMILGGLVHPARSSTLQPDDGPQYLSEFNGIVTNINNDGELIVTFRGIPTNISALNNSPSGKIPEPTFDDSVGTSYYKFDKTGSWTVSDNAKSDLQSIKIDKTAGTITVTSGQIKLTMTKGSQDTTLKTKTLVVNADTSMTTNTTDWATYASSTAKIKSPKIAFGTDGTELLDQITKLIDAIGKLTAISPVGPCSALISAPQWSGVDAVKSAINGIKGSL
jgi:hypothetical protein